MADKQEANRLASLARAQMNVQNDGQQVRHSNPKDDNLGDEDFLNPGRQDHWQVQYDLNDDDDVGMDEEGAMGEIIPPPLSPGDKFNITSLIMEPKGKIPKPTKKVKKGSVPQRLFDKKFNYKEEEPLLRKQRKNKNLKNPSPPPPIEVKESKQSDTKATPPLDSIASEHMASEQPESEHLKSREPELEHVEYSIIDESKGEIPLLDITGEPMNKNKKKGEKKGKGKRERPDSDEKRKTETRQRKKDKKEETKKVIIKSLNYNKKWEEVLRAKDVGVSTSRPLTTARIDMSEWREDLNGDKAAEDAVAGSGTHDPRA
ncbi:uncharacterized protein LOC124887805 [Capsicum annuum]|uniref:uncharacterized protein LOC124887805 n=1 Tax=Capsicum annuum TaxID=4072 RepID=UPI001FB094AE|nr:uncharacterized protein LOC124887805 [Capsicum annuum]